jgi:two-component system LytT family response regulator
MGFSMLSFAQMDRKEMSMKRDTVHNSADIIRCPSDINYTTIYLKDKHKLVVAKTLKEFEEMLSSHSFFRGHNSHLINLTFIKSYNKGKGAQ